MVAVMITDPDMLLGPVSVTAGSVPGVEVQSSGIALSGCDGTVWLVAGGGLAFHCGGGWRGAGRARDADVR